MSVETITIPIRLDDSAVHSVFVDAIEYGIGYWCDVDSYRWNLPDTTDDDVFGFRAEIRSERFGMDGEQMVEQFVIDRDAMVRGLVGCATGVDVPYLSSRTQNVARAMLVGDPYWANDHDAITADQIVQVAVFGEVVFG